VRDSLANKEIHDVDILCLPESATLLSTYLIELGFKRVDLYDPHKLALYNEIRMITQPWTFIKNDKIIQIIKPAGESAITQTIGSLIDAYYSLLSDVDISSCGVFLEKDRDSIIKLKEAHEKAITHCRSNVYDILKNNRMFGQKRTDNRSHKLANRGWTNLSDNNDIKVERRVKLHGLQKPEYNYKSYRRSKYSISSATTLEEDMFNLDLL